MSEAKHTPGPWSNEGKPITVRGLHFLSHAHYESEEGEANARLIAAAPDLLAALKTFVSEYVELVESGDAGFWDPEKEAKVIAARAAIAKAEGRS